jgi:tyrosinase
MYRYAFPLNKEQKIDGINDANARAPVRPTTDPLIPVTLLTLTPYAQFSRTPYTVRHPKTYDDTIPFSANATWAQGISVNDGVMNSLNNGVTTANGVRPGGRQLVQQVSDLFAKLRSYPPFSNPSWVESQGPRNYTSLEGVHNSVHVFIGGMTFGHMAMTGAAAFDHAFWMHHG